MHLQRVTEPTRIMVVYGTRVGRGVTTLATPLYRQVLLLGAGFAGIAHSSLDPVGTFLLRVGRRPKSPQPCPPFASVMALSTGRARSAPPVREVYWPPSPRTMLGGQHFR